MTNEDYECCANEGPIEKAALEIIHAVLTLEYYDPKWLALDERTRKAALLRLIRNAIQETPNELEMVSWPSHFAAFPSHYTSGYVVWIYKRGDWEIKELHCAEFYEPGPKPDFEGEYENQCVTQACVKRQSGG